LNKKRNINLTIHVEYGGITMADRCHLKSLNKGDFFTLGLIDEPKESQVYVKDYYDRTEKKWFCYKFSDVNEGRFLAPDRIVGHGFTF
jgi:hypothetical protein